jgi:23S rRNA pseudouridine1911/1915/1917 synthase
MDLSVPTLSQGERLDRFLARAQADLSRSRLQQLIREGRVLVNGKAARASHRLNEGDAVRLDLPPEAPSPLAPEDRSIAVVHEDDQIIVIDKPPGWVVHPGAGVRTGTLVHALLHRYPEIAGVGGPGRPGIVHRLDKDTSGLMVVARTPRAYLFLVEALRVRRVHRHYDAIVWGDPREDSGTIEAALGRDLHERKRMAVVLKGGRPARTRWRIAERFGVASRLEIELDTGRTHQIRVHLAHLRHPVVGDSVYGGGAKKLLSLPPAQRSLALALLACLPRQALHASMLVLPHPATGKELEFRSAWPDDFARALDVLRENRPHGMRA